MEQERKLTPEENLQRDQEIKEAIQTTMEDSNIDVSTDDTFEPSENGNISEEDVKESIKLMDDMNFVEVSRYKLDLEKTKEEFESAKALAESLLESRKQMEEIDQAFDKNEGAKSSLDDYSNMLNNKIEEANVEIETGISDMKQYLEEYPATMERLNQLIQYAEEKIKGFDDVEKTTSYMTNCMLDILKKKAKELDNLNVWDPKTLKIYYKETINIFENRTSIDYILEKIPDTKIQVRRLRQSLKKDRTDSTLKNTQKHVCEVLGSTFNPVQMASFEEYLINLFQSEDESFYFQYILYLIYKKEKETGKFVKHKWIELLIMNVCDIQVGLYDLPGGKEEYDKKLIALRDAMFK